ncbi:unnamed protein product [Arabis nemorensis]|uniref:Uncharacterized protein n=1 Tax=Arabis nemorensis TaxID=586526 RepID=A0A565BZX9_9BRAS|nr:unnamed protein product [Arabis nemorensis]
MAQPDIAMKVFPDPNRDEYKNNLAWFFDSRRNPSLKDHRVKHSKLKATFREFRILITKEESESISPKFVTHGGLNSEEFIEVAKSTYSIQTFFEKSNSTKDLEAEALTRDQAKQLISLCDCFHASKIYSLFIAYFCIIV